MKHFFCTLLFIHSALILWAQNNYKAGIFPSASMTIQLPKTWEFNLGIENRNNFFTGQFESSPEHLFELERLDFTPIISRGVGINKEIGAGYMLRYRGGEFYHRFLQQISFVERYNSFRMGYRIRTDQTINPNETVTIRFRFRSAAEIPLQGTKLDQNEFYLKLSLEQVLYFTQGVFDYGARTLITPGYYLNGQHKFELGFNHRFSRLLIANRFDQQFWIQASWFFKPNWNFLKDSD